MNVVINGMPQKRVDVHQRNMLLDGHAVRLLSFNAAHDTWVDNREIIRWADRLDVIGDPQSADLAFNCGIAFALHKPIHVVHLVPSVTNQALLSMQQVKTRENSSH